eukprot:CAMPEP_0113502650 /NCGR_PEP_ID=MMETSP0014_2-20120614/33688_1 /TAXON_ID=2857 /ORGANISM="Nitzschia sp." /LENGTH=211 /DNA_ID=CAMNT_0000397493 /DNA_START=11 /DNA_END=643 /DNA_ORIENTATION=- /assembly_acc=CAM_ASM_000159
MMSSSTMKSASASESGSGSVSTSTTPSRNSRHNYRQHRKLSYVFEPPTIPSLPVIFPYDTRKQASTTTQQEEEDEDDEEDPNKSEPQPQLHHFPIHRIYCVGRNYQEHIEEMGGDTQVHDSTTTTKERTPPVFFTKPVLGGVVVAPGSGSASGSASAASSTADDDDNNNNNNKRTEVKYPPATKNLHYEVELVVAIGKDAIEEEEKTEKDD